MLHASTAFPSHWVPLFEALLVIAGLGLAVAGFAPLDRLGRRLLSLLRRAARRPTLALLLLAFATTALAAGIGSLLGPPVPHVVDEQSYLLAAETYATGRVAAPPHRLWRHFEANHVLHSPTYASKYPPAQGAALAAGIRLAGTPAVGLWLSAGLLVAASGWMLLAWAPPPWALLGAVLVALRLGVGGYWNQSYWGGSVAAIGALLLLGAARRLYRRVSLVSVFALVAGLAILANSRPYEGLLVSLPVAAMLAWALCSGRLKPRPWLLLVAPTLLALLVLAAGIGLYNQAITGSALEFPHQLGDRAGGEVPLFAWQNRDGQPELPTGLFGWRRPRTPGLQRLGLSANFFVGLPMLLPLLLTAAAVRDPWSRFAMLVFLGVWVGHALIYPWWPHYSAPALAGLLAVTVVGQRHLLAVRFRTRRIGPALFAAAWIAQLAIFLVQVPAHRPDASDPSRQRARLAHRFEEAAGLHVLLVRYPPGWSADWSYNGPDIDQQKVIWATDLGDGNDDLLAYYPDRSIWHVPASFTATDPTPRLLRPPDY
jgi:hypothetical protein